MDWHDVTRLLILLGYLTIIGLAHYEARQVARWGHKIGLYFMSAVAASWAWFYITVIFSAFPNETLAWMSRLAHAPTLAYGFFLLYMARRAHDLREAATKRFNEEQQ